MKGKIYTPKTFNVLLADDDKDDCQIFIDAFRELALDIGVYTVKNGQEALDFLSSSNKIPDILFLDLNMPVINGIECLTKIREQSCYKDLCIVIYSTSSNPEEIENTFVLGANVYVKKPSDFEELKTILYKIVAFNGHCIEPYLKREYFMFSLGTDSM